ncbi:hypothetical protein PTTG_08902 [Puccinia triticina 1-1 BBBD Race 1]|uniref:Uncharacterized protein n=1 Tax=Puccinia triticina (isolate 1-1 / race 1 (BBBD)) TaxID=630390 RepID=A0A0C4F6X7_PUCT1|nr:hypothetical protein PTTG_08902 [Puccinia triticina 1-1 BBBD Race 1]
MTLLLLLITLLIPAPAAARECFWYTDSLGRRRRRCRGLVPGIIAALVVGLFVVLAFISLAFVLRRRQQRATLEQGPVFTQQHPGNLMSQQQQQQHPPPAYPPPGYPAPAHYYRLEKNDTPGLDPAIQPPPPANLADHHHPPH